MKRVTKLREEVGRSTSTFVLLNIITCGGYSAWWMLRNTPLIERAVGRSIVPEWIPVLLMMSFIVSICTSFIQPNGLDLSIWYYVSITASTVFLIGSIYFAFKMKNALVNWLSREYKFSFKTSRLWAFLFTFYYVNYCINSIEYEYSVTSQ